LRLPPRPLLRMGFSAGWAVPEGRGPTGPSGGYPVRGPRPVSRGRRKSVQPCRDDATAHSVSFFVSSLDTGRAAYYFRPASGIDRSASWCRFPGRGAGSARSILTDEAPTGRRVPERPARPCGLEPADAGGPGTLGPPLEDVEKRLTSITAGSGLAFGQATSRSSWISLSFASDVRDQGLAQLLLGELVA
jgi:hypothetical protein